MIIGRYNAGGDLPRYFVWDEQGTPIRVATFSMLIERIYKVRNKIGGDLAPMWIERVADDLCDKYKIQKCSSNRDDVIAVRKIRGGDVARFVYTVKNWILKGGKPVDSQEAERRAEICASCPMNVPVAGCTACRRLASSLFPSLKDHSTAFDAELKGCGGCGCDLKLKVWLPFEVLPDGTEDAGMYDEACWIRLELESREREQQLQADPQS